MDLKKRVRTGLDEKTEDTSKQDWKERLEMRMRGVGKEAMYERSGTARYTSPNVAVTRTLPLLWHPSQLYLPFSLKEGGKRTTREP